jgi:toxin-antitoxin system PIN domain toxin
VIALDTNILVYAHREDSPFHEAAFRRVAGLAEGLAVWGIPWPCLHEFLAIVTHPRIYVPSTPLARALDQVDAWLESPTLTLLTETERHWSTLHALLAGGRIAGAQVHDARVAALCRQHGVRELWSTDRKLQPFLGAQRGEPAT